jgi:aspartate aminotransferase-like enzyme
MSTGPRKTRLFTPGPTPVPDEVLRALSAPIIHHRTPQWQRSFQEVLNGLRALYGTSGEPVMYTASGTGAMESAVCNLVEAGDEVIVASFGRFGERWAEIATAYGATVHHHQTVWGDRPDHDAIAEFAAQHPNAKVLFTTHSETATGAVSDAAAIASAVRAKRGDLLLVLDAISSLGAIPIHMDEWGYDAVITGSQKALMVPPGLAFAALSEKAEQRTNEVSTPRFYLDWRKTLAAQRKSPPSTPFTPALTIVLGLEVALDMIAREGSEAIHDRHVLYGRATRAAVAALGLDLFGPDDDSSCILTSVRVPDGVDGAAIPKKMRDEYGITIAGGQAHLKGKIVRLGHCGWVDVFDLVGMVAAFERALVELGHDAPVGEGVAAAQRVLTPLLVRG